VHTASLTTIRRFVWSFVSSSRNFSVMEKSLLDKAAFDEKIDVFALRTPAKLVGDCMKKLSGQLFNRPRLKNVAADAAGQDTRLVILGEGKNIESLSKDAQEYIQSNSLEVIPHQVTLGYDHFPMDVILRKILPEGVDIPSSFETVGHIAHLNLRDEHQTFQKLIGEVLLDKNPRLKTVVNKTGSIDNVFRNFHYEVIAGEPSLDAEVLESGCRLRFNYGKVYWNSRLQGEHARLIRNLKPSDTLCDMFAGVGPFAVPAAKKGCTVYANDLNPESYKALCNNAKLNKVEGNLEPFNLDAREFIKKMTAEQVPFNQVVMNLPATAVEFCDVFQSAFENYEHPMPTINCYCFSKADDPKADAVKQVEEHLGMVISTDPDLMLLVHDVRDVAPKKRMLCVSFKMPRAAARDAGEPEYKKLRVE